MLQQAGCGLRQRTVGRHAGTGFDRDTQAVHGALAGQDALVMRRELSVPENQLLDLRGEHIDATHNHHVIAAASDFFHAAHGPRATRQQAGQIAGAVADDGQRFFAQAGENQFAHLPVGQQLAGVGVDDLGIEVVFPDGRSILGFHTFAGHAGAYDFAQAVDIHRVYAHAFFNRLAHVIGPGLGSKNAGTQAGFGG